MPDCILQDITLVEGIDYEVDLENGLIKFLSSGVMGPTLEYFTAVGYCGAQIDWCENEAPIPPEPPFVPSGLNIPCAESIDECLPCNDDPILNLSAEGPDSNRFLFNVDVVPRPPLGYTYGQLGCKRWCYSEVSAADAALCATQQSTECVLDTWRQPSEDQITPGPQVVQYTNQAQLCSFACPDGTTTGYLLSGGRVVAGSQSEANAIAFSIACNLARAHRICILTNSTLNNACVDTDYTKSITAIGGRPFIVTFSIWTQLPQACLDSGIGIGSGFPYYWSVISGSLPSGITLNPCSGTLTGTPTSTGTFMFEIEARDADGYFNRKVVTLVVSSITPDTLPDFTLGQQYNQILSLLPAGISLDSQTWTITSGSLPPGLELTDLGVLFGTPSGPPDTGYQFTVRVAFTSNNQSAICEKTYELNDATTITAYYKLDSYSGAVIDSVSDNDLNPVSGVPAIVTGKIDNAYQGGAFIANRNESVFNINNKDVTIRAWYKRSGPGTADLFYKISGTTTEFFGFFDDTTGADLLIGLQILDAVGQPGFPNTTFVLSGPITQGDWHYLVGIFRHGVEIELFVDGVSVGTSPYPHEIGGAPSILGIELVSLPTPVSLDELAFWNGLALSSAEIAEDYNGGAGRTWPFS